MPRQILIPSDSGEVRAQLHLFSDASEVGYGTTAYVRCEINENRWVCNSLVAKSRVAPIKKVTVPRLQLTAAVLASRLFRMIDSQINVKFEKVIFWTDSVLVLRYIRNTSARFFTFVANRVQELLECSKAEQWRYLSTKSIPANMASRGSLLKEDFLKFWFNGPDCLEGHVDTWPAAFEATQEGVTLELKKTVQVNVTEVKKQPLDVWFSHHSQ